MAFSKTEIVVGLIKNVLTIFEYFSGDRCAEANEI